MIRNSCASIALRVVTTKVTVIPTPWKKRKSWDKRFGKQRENGKSWKFNASKMSKCSSSNYLCETSVGNLISASPTLSRTTTRTTSIFGTRYVTLKVFYLNSCFRSTSIMKEERIREEDNQNMVKFLKCVCLQWRRWDRPARKGYLWVLKQQGNTARSWICWFAPTWRWSKLNSKFAPLCLTRNYGTSCTRSAILVRNFWNHHNANKSRSEETWDMVHWERRSRVRAEAILWCRGFWLVKKMSFRHKVFGYSGQWRSGRGVGKV